MTLATVDAVTLTSLDLLLNDHAGYTPGERPFLALAQPAVEGKYGLVTCSNKQFHPGEPVFILRATDLLAPEVIYHYAAVCRKAGCDEAYVHAAIDHAHRIHTWQSRNRHLVKIPD